CFLEKNQITLKLKKKEAIVEVADEISELDKPLNYDDLEDFEYRNEKTKAAEQSKKERRILVGSLDQKINIQCKISAHGSIHLLAIIEHDLKEICESKEATFDIILQLSIDQQLYQSRLNVSLTHPEQFLGIALDFGSESSQ